MLKAENRRATTVERWTGRTTAQDPLLYFFIERYREAYVIELDEFIAAVETGRPCVPASRTGAGPCCSPTPPTARSRPAASRASRIRGR